MTDKLFGRTLQEDEEIHSPVDQLVGSYRTNSFFELYNNQSCIKNDLTRKSRTTSNSLNRSEEDEESSNLNDDDLNFDDLDDFGKEPRDLNNEISSEDSEPNDEEELDKFDEDDNQENLGADDVLNGIPINQRFRKQRSNSRTIHEDELSTSFKQYAKSLPVNIPNNNFKPFSTNNRGKNRNDENLDLDWVCSDYYQFEFLI